MNHVPVVSAFEKKCSCGTSIRFDSPLEETESFKDFKCPRCGAFIGEGFVKLAEAVNRYNAGAEYLNALLNFGYSDVDFN